MRHTLKETKYLFIDAAYLNFRLKDWSHKYFDNYPITLDYEKLSAGYDKTFYYDALASGDSHHEDFLNSLRELPDFHVFTGRVKGENKKKRQKQVDIMLAVHALTHTIRGNMNAMTLLAGDEDFTPLVSSLIQEGMNVTVWASSESLSNELRYSADRRIELDPITTWKNYTSKSFAESYPTLHIKADTYIPPWKSFEWLDLNNFRFFIKEISYDYLTIIIENLSTLKLTEVIGKKESLIVFFRIQNEINLKIDEYLTRQPLPRTSY